MALILHIADRDLWRETQADGAYYAESLATEGFIHFSTPDQITRTAARFYHGQPNLALLVVDTDKLESDLRYEDSDGEPFPHLYGPLNLDAIVRVIDFPPNADGSFDQPKLDEAKGEGQ